MVTSGSPRSDAKDGPVLVLTRTEVLDVRALVAVAEITTSKRGLAVEVKIDHEAAGVERDSVINCDGIHTVAQTTLTHRVGTVDATSMEQVCWAVNYALGC